MRVEGLGFSASITAVARPGPSKYIESKGCIGLIRGFRVWNHARYKKQTVSMGAQVNLARVTYIGVSENEGPLV